MTGTKICPPDHRHGETWNCYRNHGCKCPSCRARNAAKKTEGRRRAAYGQTEKWVYEYADVTNHVNMLRSRGMTVNYIAERSGIGVKAISRICRSQQIRIAPVVAESLLGVRYSPKPLARRDTIPAVGTVRRLQALNRIGWHSWELMERMGKHGRYSTQLFNAKTVEVCTFEKVRDLYDELWNQTPPDTVGGRRAKLRAERKGWPPPMMWDDIDNDEGPAVVEVERFAERLDWDVVDDALAGHKPNLSPPERREVITRLNNAYWSATRIGAWIGCSNKTVDRIRAELGLVVPHQNEIRDAA
jgi:hypothetical protein